MRVCISFIFLIFFLLSTGQPAKISFSVQFFFERENGVLFCSTDRDRLWRRCSLGDYYYYFIFSLKRENENEEEEKCWNGRRRKKRVFERVDLVVVVGSRQFEGGRAAFKLTVIFLNRRNNKKRKKRGTMERCGTANGKWTRTDGQWGNDRQKCTKRWNNKKIRNEINQIIPPVY